MKYFACIRTQTRLLLLVAGVFVFIGCSNDMEEIQFFDQSDMPVQVVKDSEIIQSKKGNVQLRLIASIINVYDGEESKTEYPEGIYLEFFNKDKEVSTSLSAKYAVSYDSKKIMEARNNVVIIDYDSGDTTYMESLIWDKKEKKIYSDKPLKSVNGSRVTYGDGFESDENFKNPQIFHQRGTLEWNE
ncbi:MAG: LPS export ABC transporter periplasmic protein LptC [Bacteroidales bacterium]|nr:LPS export ABC transporter periplasmic protein LptC [Bacteroidales bacterium]